MLKEKLASEMARLSCEIARACNKKEVNFAAQYNLTPAEFRCLRLFTGRPTLSIKTLTTELELTPGRITHILTSLEEKNYITRLTDPNDKRNVMVKLTKKSRPFINRINQNHVKIHKEILDQVKSNNQTVVIDVMQNVVNALKAYNKK